MESKEQGWSEADLELSDQEIDRVGDEARLRGCGCGMYRCFHAHASDE